MSTGFPYLNSWSWLPYLAAATICFFLTQLRGRSSGKRAAAQQLAWSINCIAVSVLGLLRPYEIHGTLAGELRELGLAGGWYETRASYQSDFLVVLLFSATTLLIAFFFGVRSWSAATKTAVCAVIGLTILMLTNIVSLHALDHALNYSVGALTIRVLLEVTGLSFLSLGAVAYRLERNETDAAS